MRKSTIDNLNTNRLLRIIPVFGIIILCFQLYFSSSIQDCQQATISNAISSVNATSVTIVGVIASSNNTSAGGGSSKATTIQQDSEDGLLFNNSFGSCLMVMDDNHFLIEWLAYHYHVLPLRRLIVAVDPKSKTSPKSILDRYQSRGLMKITIWHPQHYMPSDKIHIHKKLNLSDPSVAPREFKNRQKHFNARCLSMMKYEGANWVATIDPDEFILPNRNASKRARIPNSDTIMDNNITIHQMLQSNKRKIDHIYQNSSCISMPRIQFGIRESSDSAIQQGLPSGYNGTDFLSMRWRYCANKTNPVSFRSMKSIIYVSDIEQSFFSSSQFIPSRPIYQKCSAAFATIPRGMSPFVLHHYVGTYQQKSSRTDGRNINFTQQIYQQKFAYDDQINDNIRPWLSSFVEKHGTILATELLQGVGKVDLNKK